ncbi:antistasin-like isoform X2 [Gigantopelta aegis]|uniref:antistasin-like isoform X2 n=1 Tax=Gigantopelta aegis TaxID=1735272 RepID=UPI001B888996|nr:antistasin-like isoform X2 [Gigantopelta aegis]
MTSLLTSLVVVVAALLVSSTALLLPTACSVCSIPPAGCRCGEILDGNGCPTGGCRQCIYKKPCSSVMCLMYCQYGFCHSRVTGCPVCKCRQHIIMPGPIKY